MRHHLLALAALVGLTASAFAATDDELRTQIVGSWGEDAACTTGALTFNADGTFSSREGSDSERSGTYQIVDGVLSGSSAEGSMPEVTVRFEGDMLFLESNGRTLDELTRCA